MRTDRDYYRILGLDRKATAEEIKQRYRALVREHHPDVNPNQHAGMGQNTFLQIVEAYQLLSDPDKRKEYDQVWNRRAAPSAAAGAPKTGNGPAVIEGLLAEARRYFEAKETSETVRTCRRILQLDKENSAAFELLGDAHVTLKRNEEAISYYTMAQQFAPNHSAEVTAKIERLMKREEKVLHEAIHGKPIYKRAPAMALIIAILLMLAVWGFSLRAGPPMQGFAFFDATPAHALGLFLLDAFLLGSTLAASGVIARYDDEMLAAITGDRSASSTPPLGLLIPIVSLLNFYLAVIAYLIYALMHERFSLSFIKAALALLALGLVFAAPHSESLIQIMLYGTGPAFAIMCGGWLIADVARPHW